MPVDKKSGNGRPSLDSVSSISTTSIVFDHLNDLEIHKKRRPHLMTESIRRDDHLSDFDDDDPLKQEMDGEGDLETGPFLAGRDAYTFGGGKYMDRKFRRIMIVVAGLLVAAWVGGLFVYIASKSYKHATTVEHDPEKTKAAALTSGKKITMDQVRSGTWYAASHDITWIAGPKGEDGLMIEVGADGKDYIVIEDVRAENPDSSAEAEVDVTASRRTLMKNGSFRYQGRMHIPSGAEPSRDQQKVLLRTEQKSNWRHSHTACYWIWDVATETAEPLIPASPDARVQNAQWSPTSDAIVFTRENNLYLRTIGSKKVTQITKDGGADLFYGVPDWVYEEEVIAGASTTWWSEDGKYVAFLRTNETGVPAFPVQYFMSRPSGASPKAGEETYPEVRDIKYPRSGSHNPVVDVQFYDIARGDVFTVDINGGFADEDRLITTVLWAGSQVIVKETNRVSDIMRVVLIDVKKRTGKTTRTVDVGKIDGGWFEISQNTKYIPADPKKGRDQDGYIDTVIHNDGDHLAYFSPPDNPDPIMLTSGPGWEVVDAPSAVDLENNLVYFIATKEGSTQRHVYSVQLDGKNMKSFTDTEAKGYYDVSFSSGAGYALLSYKGPKIPWQKVVSTPTNKQRYEVLIEENKELAESARKYDLPLLNYGTLNVEGVELNYLERRPPQFSEKKKYPVLFHQYSGPGSQSVSQKFSVDFQSYVAASLGYIVVTFDGRGTGFIGRKNRVLVRSRLGEIEAQDQIAAAKHWASLGYVDPSRIAIWGWSYGGFQTLKTLEADAGRTFSYGMAVAPVTDWRFYDSIYTERYMLTPQQNEDGYTKSAVHNVSALASNKRFLLMHGASDDNVHFQNSLTLLDKLDMGAVENYDVHVFPDSDHSIFFHNANKIIYDSELPFLSIKSAECHRTVRTNNTAYCRARELAGQRIQRRVAQSQQCKACRASAPYSTCEGKGKGQAEEEVARDSE